MTAARLWDGWIFDRRIIGAIENAIPSHLAAG